MTMLPGSTLADQVRAALAWDRVKQTALLNMLETLWENVDRANDGHEGARLEHARTRELTEALVQAVEAIQQSIARSDDYGDSHCSQPIREALSRISEALK